MDDSINSFLGQFAWEPAIVGTAPAAARAVVGGMGGSHLAANLLASALPELGLVVHHDYGLPAVPEGAMAIAVSHSGNTEETLDFLQAAHGRGMPCAAISLGGKLIEYAAEQGIAHIILPPSIVSPRSSVGYHAVALLTLLNRPQELAALRAAAASPERVQAASVPLGQEVPLIYASQKNDALARYLKVQFNETSKAAAFFNTFPEFNHNEMIATLAGGTAFRVMLIRDHSDDPRIINRMNAFVALAEELGVAVEPLVVPEDPLARLVSVAMFAQERSLALAKERGVDPNDTAVIENFKKRIG